MRGSLVPWLKKEAHVSGPIRCIGLGGIISMDMSVETMPATPLRKGGKQGVRLVEAVVDAR